jgi:hypothetical protein
MGWTLALRVLKVPSCTVVAGNSVNKNVIIYKPACHFVHAVQQTKEIVK